MRKYSDWSIRTKLLLGFIFGVVCMTIITAFGLKTMNDLNNTYSLMLEDVNEQKDIFSYSLSDFKEIEVNVNKILLNPRDTNTISALSSNITVLQGNIGSRIDGYVKNVQDSYYVINSGVDSSAALQIKSTMNNIVNSFNLAISHVNSDELTKANEIISSVDSQIKELDAQLLWAVETVDLNATATVLQNKESITFTMYIIGGVCGLSLLLTCLLAVITSGAITKPISELVKIAKRTAGGDLDIKIASNRRDEIGVLANNFDEVVKMFRVIEREIIVFRDEVNEKGDFEYRMDISKYTGDYKKLIRAINETFDGQINDMISILTTVKEYARGNFSYILPPMAGKKSALNESVNMLRSHLTAVTEDITHFIEHVTAGDLGYRINTDKHINEWKVLAKLMNQFIETVTRPIREVARVLKEMAEGKLKIEFLGTYNGEFRDLQNTVNETLGLISGYMNELTDVLYAMSREDLTNQITRDYLGDFAPIKDSINAIVQTFNKVLTEFNVSAEQVAGGAKQISESSMDLAEGATEQAGSVEQLINTIKTISGQTNKNAENAEEANRLATSAKMSADEGNNEMTKMLDAMSGINDASQDISKIIKVIEEIALQTNLLALNASVEAAHAGVHGKGFTVVADQVRNLADRSKQAARQTTALIEDTVAKVSNGMGIANQTADMLKTMVEQISSITTLVEEVAFSSNEQAKAISTINEGISQISNVTQRNSATSQENASSSEQLSSQAEVFRGMVARFKLAKEEQRKRYDTTKHVTKPKQPIAEIQTDIEIPVSSDDEENSVKEAEAYEAEIRASRNDVISDNIQESNNTEEKDNDIAKPAPARRVLEVVRKEPPKPESAIVKASEIKTTENTNATFFSSYDSSDFGKY